MSTLYRISAKKLRTLVKAGYETLHDLPADFAAAGPVQRQIDSVRRRRVLVEPELAKALAEIESPTAFLDFETVSLRELAGMGT